MSQERKHVICRSCHAHCGLIVDFEDGQPVATHGDKDNPAFAGYSCLRGRRLADQHSLDSRLTHSKKRGANGTHEDIDWEVAAKEISTKIKAIQDEHGPNSVAMYVGTFGYNNLASHSFGRAFMRAIGSKMFFTSVTIDQPGKGIAWANLGTWLAGEYRHEEWEALMLVGTNPIVSMNGGIGLNPAKNLFEAQKRGMKLVVIDPRETDCAKRADLHIQCRPGEDAVILASIIRQMIAEGLYDQDFIDNETEGLETLKASVEPFTPELAAARAGITPQDIIDAARIYGATRKGSVSVGTGPNMSGTGNITEYLARVIMTLCGHWRRAGETKKNAGVFIKPLPEIAACPGPIPAWGYGTKTRTRGLEETISGMPTAVLPEEILTPGKGQVKALITLGGNPMLAWPDQIKTAEAMDALDLLVCLDVRMSKTAERADYVIAPKLHYEIHGLSAMTEYIGAFGGGWGFEESYGQVSDPIMETPDGSNLCEEFELFHAMASNLGKPLEIQSFALLDPAEAEANLTHIPTQKRPTPIEAWDAAINGAPITAAQAFADPDAHKGKVYDRDVVVAEKPDDWQGRMDIGSKVMLEELADCEARLGKEPDLDQFPYRLISRRLKDMHNSNWQEDPIQRKRLPHHPAYMNPDDLASLSLKDGDAIRIESARSSITCVACSAPDVRQGCLSVPHAWGTAPDEKDDPFKAGGNTGRLSFIDKDYDKRTGIPLMSSIPVRVAALAQ